MEDINVVDQPPTIKKGFFSHVFSLDQNAKSNVMNVIQYCLIAIIPITILNKLVQRLFPEADDKKGTVELLAEAIGQIVGTLLGVYFIHRFITYIPTYSGVEMGNLNLFSCILVFLVISFNIQTKLGSKINILTNRVMELWDGKNSSDSEENIKEDESVNIIQPIVKSIHNREPGVNFDNMYTGGRPGEEGMTSGMPGALHAQNNLNETANMAREMSLHESLPQVESQMGYNEPFAANEALGGSFGTSF